MTQFNYQKNIVNASITADGNVRIGDDYITYNNYFAAEEVKIPHRLTNNIPTNADHILGRSAELKLTKDHLAQNEATILFNGIGGIGKTALATKYMAVYGSEYKHLAWITVQSTLAEAFTNNAPLLASLQITQQVQDYIAAKQLDKAFAFLFHQLNLLEHTLVVIDNANDLDDLEKYKNEFDNAQCHFLITSRNKPSEWATVDVDSLPEDEAVALFIKLHSSVSATDEAIKSLLSKLFYHTLLIELVAKAGATGIPFADLQSMIETQFIHHEGLNERVIPKGKHGNFVAVEDRKAKIEEYIWLIFKQVKGLEDNAKQLLKAMALLPVATPFDLGFLKAHFAFFNIPDAVVQLDALIERGWLQKEQAEGQKPYFKMHPLIADVVVKHLVVNVVYAEKYIWRVANLIDYDNLSPYHNLFDINKNKLFAIRLNYLFSDDNTEGVSYLLDRIGNLEENFGFYRKSAEFRERALQVAETIFDSNYAMLAVRQSNLAIIYHRLGKYDLSATLLEKALKILERIFEKTSPHISKAQSILATAYQSLGQYNRAISLLEKALESDIENFGIGHSNVAIRQGNLAHAYQELGQYDRAAVLVETALAIFLKNLEPEHHIISTCQANLAVVYQHLGKYESAISLVEMALANALKKFDANHPSVAYRQNTLAILYCKTGRQGDAKVLWQAAYQNLLKNFGEGHPHTALIKGNSES